MARPATPKVVPVLGSAPVSAGPSWTGDFPDPFVLHTEDGYVAYGTNAGGRNVQVLRSTDLREWLPAGDALPHLPSWAQAGFTWAPAVLPRPGGFVLYVTVREPHSGRQAVMVASADSPVGPFHPEGTGPLVLQVELGGSIDPSPFVDADGQAYLLWKADANAVQQPSSLWAQPLSPDGLTLTASPTELLRLGATWERPLVEAPSMVRDANRYYLFYSGGWWASDAYAVGYAVADRPLGPWQRVTASRPWFSSDTAVSGPGGQEFFTDGDDQVWMAYHGWEPGRVSYQAGGKRTFRLARVSFADGRPVVEGEAVGESRRPGWWQRLFGR